jgi:hypothetical protein
LGQGIGTETARPGEGTGQAPPISISAAARLPRSGGEVALVIGAGDEEVRSDTPLARLVGKAHRLAAALTSGEV